MPSQNEIRESITADLIALLKNGTKPWQKPWSSDPNLLWLSTFDFDGPCLQWHQHYRLAGIGDLSWL
ncbi:MAG: ArdC-like ssDNA-binding domain-containing protein [Gemmataceae bacterium]